MKIFPTFFFAALLTFLLSPIVSAAQPNVLIFLSDDQGWGDLSASGNTDLSTPNIDSLARDGASFNRFYVCPVCSPTRAEFLTGRHHARMGVYSTSAGGERINLDEVTIADAFKAAGYTTGAFGKWHNGMQYPYHPNGRGFDEFYGFCSGHWGNYFDSMLEHNGEIVKGEGFCIDDFTNQAMKFIEGAVKNDKPFFAYVPYNTPHSPMQVPDEYWDKFSSAELPLSKPFMKDKKKGQKSELHLRSALAMCENLDWNVGRVLERLDKLEVADNTIVCWFHDNGPNGPRWNGGMKGRKGSTDEGGVRSPLFMRWPGKIPKSKSIAPISSARDLLPTLCDLAEVAVPTKRPLDGRSLKPLLLEAQPDWPDRSLISQWKSKVSVRTQTHRLDTKGALYDMLNDPDQTAPIDDATVQSQLSELTDSFRKEFMGPQYEKDDRPFIIAHPDHAMTQIPARDGTAHGGIERSNRHPNCSYFRNWTSTDDRITWPAEVATAGRYEVELFYACKKGSAGASCELKFQDATLKFKIDEAHDVPEAGAEHDHYPRAESYVKDWKRVVIGNIALPKGDGELLLHATDIPGDEAMEFRLLTLRRL